MGPHDCAFLLLLSTLHPAGVERGVGMVCLLLRCSAISVMLALLLADWRLTPKPADWELRRQHDTRLSLAAQNRIEVTVRRTAALRSLPVWLRDELPPTFAIAEQERADRNYRPRTYTSSPIISARHNAATIAL